MLTAYAVEAVTDLGGAAIASPSISDDGGKIAFISDANLAGGNTELRPAIFYYDTAAESFTQVTDAPSVSQELAISGDGKRIAFVAAADLTGQNSDGNFEIFIYDIPSQSFFQVTDTLGSTLFGAVTKQELWVNEDGNRLMFVDTLADLKVFSVNDITGSATMTHVLDLTSLSTDGSLVSYSADGSYIAVSSRRDLTGNGTNLDENLEIFVYDLSSSVPVVTQITDTIGTSQGTPAINGDATRIAFFSTADLEGSGAPLTNPYVFLYDVASDTFTQFDQTARG